MAERATPRRAERKGVHASLSLGRARCPKTRPLALPLEAKGKAPQDQRSGEARTATSGHGGSGTDRLMKWVVEHDNVTGAGKCVWQSKGSLGVDGRTVEELPAYLAAHREAIRAQWLDGTYQPKPVLAAEIPKSGGGTRWACRLCSTGSSSRASCKSSSR